MCSIMKTIKTILLTLLTVGATAQVMQETNTSQRMRRLAALDYLAVPKVCGTPTGLPNGLNISGNSGAMVVDTCNNKVFAYITGVWREVGGSGGGSTDTTSLSNRINSKLNLSDTAAMLANYVRRVFRKAGSDSVFVQIASGNVFAFKDSIGGGGVTTVGAFSGSGNANGASISGSTITFGPADLSTPGMVSTGYQRFAGNKEIWGLLTLHPFAQGDKLQIWNAGSGNSAGFGWNQSGGARSVVAYTPDDAGLQMIIGGGYSTTATQYFYADSAGTIIGKLSGFTRANTSAALDVSSTTRGFLHPRMTTTQMNAISSPAAGLQIYNTTLSQPHYRDASTWQAMVGMTFGTAAPTSTPTAVGNFFLDTTNKKLYVATGTSSSADWIAVN